jgi:hypothetical protein
VPIVDRAAFRIVSLLFLDLYPLIVVEHYI